MKVLITITGGNLTGKTTLAHRIAKILREDAIQREVTIIDQRHMLDSEKPNPEMLRPCPVEIHVGETFPPHSLALTPERSAPCTHPCSSVLSAVTLQSFFPAMNPPLTPQQALNGFSLILGLTTSGYTHAGLIKEIQIQCGSRISSGILGDDAHPATPYQEVNQTLLRTLIATWIVIEGHPEMLATIGQASSSITGKTLHQTARDAIGEAAATADTPVANALRKALAFIEQSIPSEDDEDPAESISTSIEDGPEITIDLAEIRAILAVIPTA